MSDKLTQDTGNATIEIQELVFNTCSPCLVCVEFVNCAIGTHPVICEECKRAIMWAKTHMDGGVFTT